MVQKRNKKNKPIFRTIIAFLLLVPWLIFLINFLKIPEKGLLVLEGRFNIGNLSFPDKNDKILLKGEKVIGEFISKYPNLGIVAVRFDTFYRINDDWLTFRFKEKGATGWSYQADYKTDQFQPKELFPFGFPLISDSNNKTYIFEIESQLGKKKEGEIENFVAIDEKYPVFVSRHVFTKQEFMGNLKKFTYFLTKKPANLLKNGMGTDDNEYHQPLFIVKPLNLLGDEIFRFYSCVCLFPLFYYLLALKLKNNCRLLGLIFLPIFIADVFLLNRNSDYLLLSIIIIGIIYLIQYPPTKKILLPLFLILLFSASIFTIFKQDMIAERITIWLYLLLLIFAIYQILPQKTVNFIKKIIANI